jgi:hypothetical protein
MQDGVTYALLERDCGGQARSRPACPLPGQSIAGGSGALPILASCPYHGLHQRSQSLPQNGCDILFCFHGGSVAACSGESLFLMPHDSCSCRHLGSSVGFPIISVHVRDVLTLSETRNGREGNKETPLFFRYFK